MSLIVFSQVSASTSLVVADHVANHLLLIFSIVIALTILSLHLSPSKQMSTLHWVVILTAAFATMAGLRRISDLLGYIGASGSTIRVISIAIEISMIGISIALLIQLPKIRRMLNLLPTREAYRDKVKELEDRDREREEWFDAVLEREQALRSRTEELRRLIIRSNWMRERTDILFSLQKLITETRDPKHAS